MMKCCRVFILWLLLIPISVQAFDEFIIEDIQVKGLQRISLGTTFTYLPLKVGEELTADKASSAIRALYKTGFFENVKLGRDGNILVIEVVERPSIAKIEFFGNEEINTDDLTEALKTIGLTEGRVFNRSMLDQVKQELLRQYFSLGKYGVEIQSTVTPLERNRVDIAIDIEEGDAARIRQINIIGASAFDEDKLLGKFQLSQGTMFSIVSGSDKYSRQKLVGDLEVLRSYYLDRGYIHFKIESTQVSISPDKRNVYITVNLSEGEKYTVKDIKISGDLVVPAEELKELVLLEPGDIFSRQKLVNSTNKINDRLGVEGYAFANVNAIPEINEETKEVSLTFFVDPGKRVYVRRINIIGNTKTRDGVIRRELRQMEGGWISTPLVNRSKIRLQRLGYFDDIKVETPAVPGTTDQMDVNIEVTEGSTGNFTAGVGWGQESGFLLNASVTLKNLLGTGKRMAFEINNSQVNQIYSISYNNPYWTVDGISRGFTLMYRKTDAAQANLSDFFTNTISGDINFGIPLSEFTRLRLDVGYEDTDLTLNPSTSPEAYVRWLLAIKDIDPESVPRDQFFRYNTVRFRTYTTSLSYSFDTRNRAIFPDRGLLSRITGKAALPGLDLQYYKIDYRLSWYIPLAEQFTLLMSGQYGFGDGYGSDPGQDVLPFYENFYAGGTRSVRGYKGNTIGPRDKTRREDGTLCENPYDPACFGSPVGGNQRLLTRTELYFPLPFMDEPSRNFRMSVFSDAGKVTGEGRYIWNDNRWRLTYGIAAVWITPVGALVFSYAWPIDPKQDDEIESFQFNIGAPF